MQVIIHTSGGVIQGVYSTGESISVRIVDEDEIGEEDGVPVQDLKSVLVDNLNEITTELLGTPNVPTIVNVERRITE